MFLLQSYEKDNKPTTQYLTMIPLKDRTTAQIQFDEVDAYLRSKKLKWTDCFKLVTDGCSSMVGSIKGFATKGFCFIF